MGNRCSVPESEGYPEMIDEGVNGYLFEPGNVDDLREKLELLLSMSDKIFAIWEKLLDKRSKHNIALNCTIQGS